MKVKDVVVEKDIVVLIDSKFKKYIVDTSSQTGKIKGVGILDPSSLVGEKYGERVQIGNKKFWILQPSLLDKLQSIERHAQIILPRDCAQILMYCSIESGQTIVEGGIGSGSLTIALANAVAPKGKVISYDVRKDFINHALNNVKRAGLQKYVFPKKKDITEGIDERDIDAIILDIPNPWEAVKHAWSSLKCGGYFCSYSPLVSQVEKTVEEIRKYGFIEIKTFENIQREMIVSTYGTRPSYEALGHTGYLTFARKIIK
jgi:tRNA (adenine57-N1/adenine58-N1)-methyltransferase